MNPCAALPIRALCLTTLLLLSACSGKSTATVADEPTRVSIRIASTGPAAARLHFHGAIASRDEMRLFQGGRRDPACGGRCRR
jgi:hypothetical protein